MSDNEHTLSPLRDSSAVPIHSHELSVENAVGEPIPELAQPPEEGSKRPSTVDRQDTGDVLPYQPSGPQSISKAEIFESEVATFTVQAFSEAGDAEILAGGPAAKKVNWSDMVRLDLCKIAEQRRIIEAGGKAMIPANRDRAEPLGQHGSWELLDLAVADALPAKGRRCDAECADAGAYVEI
jgi:hypothetical protein